MATEVVGTAFVRIRALTTGLAKDIEDGVKKGAADIDGPSADIGEKIGKGAGGKIKEGISDGVKDGISDADRDVDRDGESLGSRLGRSIKAGISKSFDDGALGKIGARFSKALGLDEEGGAKSGDKFFKGFSGRFATFAKLGALFSPALTGAASALLQYVVSLVGQIGVLAQGMVGLGVAGAAAFGAIGLAALPLTLAFKAQTPALEAFQENLANVGHQWTEVGAATQQTLLYGLKYAANLSTTFIPMFRAFGREIGQVVSDFAVWQADWQTNERNLSRFRGILQGSVPIVRSLLEVFGNLLDVVLNVFHSAIPVAQDFAATLATITDRLQNDIGEAAASGALATTFTMWYERGKLVLGALTDIAVALWNVLSIGAGESMSFFHTFDDFAARFRAFTESETGRNRLAEIFQQANAIAHEFNGLVGDIFRAIGSNVFDAGGAEGIIGFIRTMRENLVPALERMLITISSHGDAMGRFFEALLDLFDALSKTGALDATLTALTLTLTAFTTALTLLLSIPGMDKFLGVILGIVGAFALLKTLGIIKILVPLSAVFFNLLTILGALVVPAGTLVTAFAAGLAVFAAVAAVGYLIYRNWDTIKAVFSAIVSFIMRNWPVILGILMPIVGIPMLIIKNWDKIAGFFSDLFGTIVSAVSKVPGIIGRALLGIGKIIIDAFVKALGWLAANLPGLILNAITSFITMPFIIAGYMLQLGGLLVAAFVNAIIFLVSALPGIVSAVTNFFQALPARLLGFFSEFGSLLAGIFTAGFDFAKEVVTTGGSAILTFFSELPGKIIGFITDLPGLVGEIFSNLFNTAQDIISGGISAVVGFFTGLPGQILATLSSIGNAAKEIGGKIISGIGDGLSGIASFATDLKDAIGNAFKSVVNGFIDKLNSAIPNSLGWGPARIDIPDNPIPKLARGALISRPMMAMVGEAGPEVVIPLTKPKRALELVLQSGLMGVLSATTGFRQLIASLPGANIDNTGGFTSIGTGTINTTNAGVSVGQIIVNLANGTPEEARAAGAEVWAGVQRAAAERRMIVQTRARSI